jgi:peptidoglycan/LPS O-acetylase OafA/YrhL
MLKINNIFNFLKRKTNTVNFIPQIDGLRFLAILPVIVGHLNVFVNTKTALYFNRSPFDYWLINLINSEARKGVLLFFVISGFILAIPFVKQFLYDGKIVSLKNYFLRRLTRLEVPYIFNNIVYALLLVFVAGHEYAKTFSTDIVLKHLMASLFYIHNFIFVDHRINYVTWSLEIEIQFYLLVPLLILLFKLSKKLRMGIIIFLILLFPLLQYYFNSGVMSIYNFIQYFLIGFVLVDMFLAGFKFSLSKWVDFLIGFLSILGILFLDIENNIYVWFYYFT